MFNLDKKDNCLVVEFIGDFDHGSVRQIICKKLAFPGFDQLHYLWLVGKHRAHLRLGEIQEIVDHFSELCPADRRGRKVAIVAEPGLTFAILQLLADGIDRQLPVSCQLFDAHGPAKEWIGIEVCRVR